MTCEFPDELLSAYLDGELSPEERAMVQQQLEASPDLRQLVDDLRHVSQQVRSLPRYKLDDDFTDRVVQAAMEAKAAADLAEPASSEAAPASHEVTLASHQLNGRARGSRRSRRYWSYAGLGVAAAMAACVLLMLGPWRHGWNGQQVAKSGNGGKGRHAAPLGGMGKLSATELALAQLQAAVLSEDGLAEDEVVVLRLKVPTNQPVNAAIDAALAQVGLSERSAADVSTGAMQVGAAYRSQLAAKFGPTQPGTPNPALQEATIGAADAVFVEASWEKLEKAIAALAEQPSGAATGLEISPLLSVAAATIAASTDAKAEAEGEGEGGDRPPTTANSAATAANGYMQRLNARLFRLEKAASGAVSSATSAATSASTAQTSPVNLDGKRRVRVLILVEPVQVEPVQVQ